MRESLNGQRKRIIYQINKTDFRKNRSTIYHISTLTNLIECRKLVKKSTFVCFVDLRKAYDAINRTLLWTQLANIGKMEKFSISKSSIYECKLQR